MTAEKFKNHQGFDLANFNRKYPFSDVYTYKILKNEKYGTFKENTIPPEQVRFWAFANRQNKTVRPDTPIPESYFNSSNFLI